MSSISIQIQNKKKPSQLSTLAHKCHFRAVGKSENPEVPVLFGGHNLPTLVEIGLTDLPKSGGAGDALAPLDFDRFINPISIKRGILCPPNNTGTSGFSDLLTVLKYQFSHADENKRVGFKSHSVFELLRRNFHK